MSGLRESKAGKGSLGGTLVTDGQTIKKTSLQIGLEKILIVFGCKKYADFLTCSVFLACVGIHIHLCIKLL